MVATLQRVDWPAQARSLAGQHKHFRGCWPRHVVLMQAGNCWESFGSDACELGDVDEPPGADGCTPSQRRLPASFSWTLAGGARLQARLRRRGIAHACIAESGWRRERMKRHELRCLFTRSEPTFGKFAF